jgi:hypothetical protein
MTKFTRGRLRGRFLAASRERLRQLASKLQMRHLANIGSMEVVTPDIQFSIECENTLTFRCAFGAFGRCHPRATTRATHV